jgi:hypothetical protein
MHAAEHGMLQAALVFNPTQNTKVDCCWSKPLLLVKATFVIWVV